jgi:hypothetical protein
MERPTAEERSWLLERLAELVRDGGFAPFVSAPLVEPSDDWFPEEWQPTAAGVELLIRRLLFHAHMPELRVEVADLRAALPPSATIGLKASEVSYAGLASGRVRFELHRLGDDDLLGILCHEIGRAFLDHAQIGGKVDHPFRGGSPAPSHGAQLGSIAAVYLGLGVPAANAAHSAQHTGDLHVTEWSITAAGGLPAQAMAFLLAVQRVVRDRDAAAYRAFLPNQRADFEAWCEELLDEREQLLAALELPPESQWPQVPTALTLVPFDYQEPEEHAARESALLRFNRGQKVFRVRGNRSVIGAALGTTAGMALGIPAGLALGALPAACAVLLAGAVGLGLGARSRRYRCSDPECAHPMSDAAAECPRCGGSIAGDIDHPDQRLRE